MEFALKQLPDGRGFALCDAKSGEVLPGQVRVVVSREPDLSITEVTLSLVNLPVFEG
jgi:hypothetical protein